MIFPFLLAPTAAWAGSDQISLKMHSRLLRSVCDVRISSLPPGQIWLYFAGTQCWPAEPSLPIIAQPLQRFLTVSIIFWQRCDITATLLHRCNNWNSFNLHTLSSLTKERVLFYLLIYLFIYLLFFGREGGERGSDFWPKFDVINFEGHQVQVGRSLSIRIQKQRCEQQILARCTQKKNLVFLVFFL